MRVRAKDDIGNFCCVPFCIGPLALPNNAHNQSCSRLSAAPVFLDGNTNGLGFSGVQYGALELAQLWEGRVFDSISESCHDQSACYGDASQDRPMSAPVSLAFHNSERLGVDDVRAGSQVMKRLSGSSIEDV